MIMTEQITVLLADDHSLVRRGFRRILEDDEQMKIVGEASNGIEAIRMANELKPKVVVMDLSMPELDGVQATKEIVKHLPGTEVLVLSMHAEDNYVRNALDAGAKGYLLKSAIDVDLVGAIKTVAEGKRFIGSGLKYVSQDSDDELKKLTAREKQVLQLRKHVAFEEQVFLRLSGTLPAGEREHLGMKLLAASRRGAARAARRPARMTGEG